MDDRIGPEPEPDTAGFTLVELLVCVAVLAVLAVGASLAATRGKAAESDAQRFARSYASARQLAVQGQERRGLRLTPRTSQAMRWQDGAWAPAGREIRWRGAVSLVAGGQAAEGPEIVFLPDGRSSAFSIRFGRGTLCRSDGWTGLSCETG